MLMLKTRTWIACATLLTLSLLSYPLQASASEHGNEASSHGEHETEHHLNHLAFFGGITKESSHGHTLEEATFGIDYVRHVSPHFGLGAIVDHAGGEIDSTVLAASVVWHPVGGLYLLAAPGVEWVDDEHGSSDSEFLVRVGIGYDFEIGERFTLGPVYNVDFVDGEEIQVFGLTFGFGF